MALNFDSPTYPYSRVVRENTMRGMEKIPYQLLTYLMDMPDANGYQPVDDNSRPRVRLMKYLWYDDDDPLSRPLPTPAQKKSMIFDPYNPDINTDEDKARHPQGYRLLWQRVRGQSMLDAKSFIKCYTGRIMQMSPFITTIGVFFDIYVDVNLETNTRTSDYDRSVAMEQCIWDAFNGVNITGIGTTSFQKYNHADNGSGYLWDDGQIVGRSVHLSFAWSDADNGIIDPFCETC